MLKIALKYLLAWIAGIFVCVVLASVFSTQRVIGALIEAGGAVGIGERLSMTMYDAVHFGSLFGMVVTVAFLIAFSAGMVVYYIAKVGRPFVFTVAGSVAILVMLLLMQMVFFGVPIVAGARDGLGLSLQMLAGAIGGYVFHRLSRTTT